MNVMQYETSASSDLHLARENDEGLVFYSAYKADLAHSGVVELETASMLHLVHEWMQQKQPKKMSLPLNFLIWVHTKVG
jgi:hypothetical protein